MCFVFFGLALLTGVGRSNLIRNPGFEEPLAGTWDTLALGAGYWRFERSDTLGSGSGFAARACKYLPGYAAIYQVDDVPGPDLVFNFDARFGIDGGTPDCWPVAAVVLHYLNSAGIELGSSKFYRHDEFCTWASSDTVHLIDVGSVQGWRHYSLEVRQEIAGYLRGVNPDQVRKVKVELYAYASGT